MATIKVGTLSFEPVSPSIPRYVAEVDMTGGNAYQIDLNTSIEFGSHRIAIDTLTIENGVAGTTITVAFGSYTFIVYPYSREVFPLGAGLNSLTVTLDSGDLVNSTFLYLSEGTLAGTRDNQFSISVNARKLAVPKIEVFTVASTYVWTPDPAASSYHVMCRGGGGGGGYALAAAAGLVSIGGAAGQGGWSESWISQGTINVSHVYNVDVGAAGAGGNGAGPVAAGPGGASRLRDATTATTLVSASGGIQGTDGVAGVTNAGANGGTGGAAPTGQILITGQGGGPSLGLVIAGRGSAVMGNGGGEGGARALAVNSTVANQTAGVAATDGGGGRGAVSMLGGVSANGGAGGAGYVIIETWY